jgi:hypothetical protein
MAKINKSDATCRDFKVTILQEQTISSVDGVSEEESDSDKTLEELPNKRKVEDISADDIDSDSMKIGYDQKEVPIEGLSSLKRVKV